LAAVHSLITQGIGPGATILYVLTGGFENGAAAEPEVAARTTGGWLSDAQVRALRRLARRAERARHEEWRERIKAERETETALRAAYDRAQGLIVPAKTVERIAEVIAPFAGDIRADQMPGPVLIDWRALMESAGAVSQLAKTLADLGDGLIEEENAAKMLLLIVA
jgi:hypothetical protein